MKTMKPTIPNNFIFPLTIFALITIPCSSQLNPKDSTRPDPEDAAVFARWLVNQASWGVLTTLGQGREPFGNVMSFTDAGTGTPYFYLSFLDPTGVNALRRPQSSFTLSESLLGYCDDNNDPQSPLCGKITLSGNMVLLPARSKEGAFAQAALFASHPQFQGFPLKNGSFIVFKLVIRKIFLVNTMAPPRDLTVYDYFHPGS